MKTQLKAAFVIAGLALVSGCGKSDKATVRGTFSGFGDTPIYLEQVSINHSGKIDTAVINDKGDFKFTVSVSDGQPAFYNLRCGDQTIALLLSPGEKVTVNSLGDLAHNYEVSGSEDSERIRELNRILIASRRSLDSLAGIYQRLDPQDSAVNSTLAQYSRIYIQQKRDVIAFVVRNMGSLASVYALYQRMPNGEWYFNDQRDAVYFQAVADSLSNRYPNSPHVVSLRNDARRMQERKELTEMVNNAPVSGVSYPDVSMPDAFGNKINLSSLNGKVILLDFWVSTETQARLRNAELLETYNRFHDRGFEIYQVSLDVEKLPWITAIQTQQLPWISVCDFRGMNSSGARIYNVKDLPANVLINRKGEIIRRNVPVEELETLLPKLF